MALVINGVTIPENGGEVIVDGVHMEKVICDGVVVWRKVTYSGPGSPIHFHTVGTKTLTAGVDFPADIPITVEIVGGGGGGGGSFGFYAGHGGQAGVYSKHTHTYSNGEIITMTVGNSGLGGSLNNNGRGGEKTTFGSYSVNGGAGGRVGDGGGSASGTPSKYPYDNRGHGGRGGSQPHPGSSGNPGGVTLSW